MNNRVSQSCLHKLFVAALGEAVRSHSDMNVKPLEIDLEPPLPHRIRLYIFNATDPPGGRTLGEHKIQLIVPGQRRGSVGRFDDSNGRIVILAGYQAEKKVFILWDAGMYPEFAYSRNIQVRAETVWAAYGNKVAQQARRIRGQGKEIVLTAKPQNLADAIKLRMDITRNRLVGR